MVWNLQALILCLSLVLETAQTLQKLKLEQQLDYIQLVLLNELFVLTFPKNSIASLF
jgi:hypothetical protein